MSLVKGSLKRHLNWWKENVNNKYIVDTIADGYRLPLIEIPPPELLKNNKSALDNVDFIDDELIKLTHSGVVKKVAEKPTVVNALTVAINASGKKRLVLDLRTVILGLTWLITNMKT
jgi:hypothetical protein